MSATLSPQHLAIIHEELRRRARARAARLIEQRYDPLGYMAEHFGGQVWGPDLDWRAHDGDIYAPRMAEIAEAVVDTPVIGVESCNSYGKTHMAARIIAWFAATWGAEMPGVEPSCEVYVSAAPPLRNVQKLWGELKSLRAQWPDAFPDTEITSEKLYFLDSDGNRRGKHLVSAVSIPPNKTAEEQAESFTGKHARAILFVLDDANTIAPPIWRAIKECMTSGFARLVFFYNPRMRWGEGYDRVHTPGRSRPFFVSAFDHPNVLTGATVIPGAVTRAGVVADTLQSTRVMREGEAWDKDLSFSVPADLVGATGIYDDGRPTEPLPPDDRFVVDQGFCSRTLGRAPKIVALQLFPGDLIDEARSRYDEFVALNGAPPGVRPRLGLDVGETGDYTALWGRWGLFLEEVDRWQGDNILSAYIETEERAAEHYHRLSATRIDVDSTGLGAGVPGHLAERGCNASPVRVSSKASGVAMEVPDAQNASDERRGRTFRGAFATIRDEMLWAWREWLARGGMLPPNSRLLAAMQIATYEKDEARGVIRALPKDTMKRVLGFSPDEFDAAMLTFAPGNGNVWGGMVEYGASDGR